MTAFDSANLQTVPTLRKDKKDSSNLLNALASLYVNGAPLKFERLFWQPAYQRVALPLYPFRGEKYWLNLDGALDLPPNAFPLVDTPVAEDLPELPELHPLISKVVSRTSKKTVFETSLKTTSPWTDHRVLDSTIFPGTGYVEMAARGFAAISGQSWQSVIVKEMAFELPLMLSYREEKKVFLSLEQTANGKGDTKFVISGEGNVIYCRGRIVASSKPQEQVQMDAELSGRESEMKIGVFYGELRSRGLEYGARFANVRELWLGAAGSGEAFGRITNDSPEAGPNPFHNAVVLDGCLQVFGAALATMDEIQQPGAFVPATVTSISFAGQLPTQVWSHVKVSAIPNGRGAMATIRVLDDEGNVLAKFENLELRRTMTLALGKRSGVDPAKSAANQIFKSRAHAIELLKPLSKRERVALMSKWLNAEIRDTMGQAAEGLNIEKLPPSAAFLEIGLDSLLVTELQRRIQEKMEFRFKPMQGLDYQSIESMAEFIHDEVLTASIDGGTAPEKTPEETPETAVAD
jgi:acyl transferase domain-containing protein